MGLSDKTLKKTEVWIASPAAGRCVSIGKVPDPAFSGEIMGKGVAIEPADGKFYAPADGVVSTLFPTLHAIGITTPEGAEILLHVGIDTVKLNGKHFTAHVKQNDTVKKGDLILEADLAAIAAGGCQTITPVLVCNTPDFREVVPGGEKDVAAGDAVIEIKL